MVYFLPDLGFSCMKTRAGRNGNPFVLSQSGICLWTAPLGKCFWTFLVKNTLWWAEILGDPWDPKRLAVCADVILGAHILREGPAEFTLDTVFKAYPRLQQQWLVSSPLTWIWGLTATPNAFSLLGQTFQRVSYFRLPWILAAYMNCRVLLPSYPKAVVVSNVFWLTVVLQPTSILMSTADYFCYTAAVGHEVSPSQHKAATKTGEMCQGK